MRYFITFPCYGQRLHGDENGSVNPLHNLPGCPLIEVNPQLVFAESSCMKQAPYIMDADSRGVVLEAICRVCLHRGWHLLAAHVRSTHVHAVVEASVRPEKIMNDFKLYASRGLSAAGRKRWARHGSTRWLWKDRDVRNAIRYVVEEQGEPMAVFVSDAVEVESAPLRSRLG